MQSRRLLSSPRGPGARQARRSTLTVLFVLLLSVLALGACSSRLVWARPGLTEAEFKRDSYECTRSSYVAPTDGLQYELYRTCMELRGYVQRWEPR